MWMLLCAWQVVWALHICTDRWICCSTVFLDVMQATPQVHRQHQSGAMRLQPIAARPQYIPASVLEEMNKPSGVARAKTLRGSPHKVHTSDSASALPQLTLHCHCAQGMRMRVPPLA